MNTVGRDVTEFVEWLQEFGFNVPEDFGAARERTFFI